ncbi:C40 family peptidase [Peptostreptococcus equinus]|uniref:SH3 domain-containing protein n=1 Tax=Peptostreptococcus equinus TaxID=3003601 RepID=A0ABY7JLU5_9FIRM|nr:SH3 domain-containing protein [Peptostreptococcus sp. CBA3647]WAW14320.1 SH3 domain-containing protein [Peptostreptococcus sp. CBA3647]
MKKAITVLGLGAAAAAISVTNVSALEQQDANKMLADANLNEQSNATSNKVSELNADSKLTVKDGQVSVTNNQTNTSNDTLANQKIVKNEIGVLVETQDNTKINTENKATEKEQTPVAENTAVETKVEETKAPAKEEAPVAETKVEETKAPAKEEAPVAETKVEETKAPAKEEAPVAETKVEETKAPTKEEAPVAETKVEETKAPAKEEAPVAETKVEETKAPAKEEAPVAETKPSDDIVVVSKAKLTKQAKETAQTVEGKINNAYYLNVRSGPSTSFSIEDVLSQKDVFKILSRHATGWYEVLLQNGTKGWSSDKYITVLSSNDKANVVNSVNAKVQKAAPTTSNKGQLKNAYALNIRKGPSVLEKLSGVVFKGDVFNVVSQHSSGWLEIMLKDGTRGWASGKYISANLSNVKHNTSVVSHSNAANNNASVRPTTNAKPVANKVTTPAKNNKVTINVNQARVNSSVNVRSSASRSGSVLGTLTGNSIVNVLGMENGWYKVLLNSGQIGYVGPSFLSMTGKTVAVSATTNNVTNRGNSGMATPIANRNNGNTGTAKLTVKDGPVTRSGQAIANLAQSFIGTPYVWGGSSPKGFDCSGLVQYVYNKVGIKLPRTSAQQGVSGRASSLANAKVGDILHMPGHVAIYIGGGRFVHAPQPGQNVKIGKISDGWARIDAVRTFF